MDTFCSVLSTVTHILVTTMCGANHAFVDTFSSVLSTVTNPSDYNVRSLSICGHFLLCFVHCDT